MNNPAINSQINSHSEEPAQASSQAVEKDFNGMTATYSPDDNKLRLYTMRRLDSATYELVKAAGFRWAPKQELFVAPMWTPGREDFLVGLCGEIGDEDTSLTERAEARADRFEDLSQKRAKESQQAQAAVERIVEHIPLGQPILVGHHSERAARRDAKRIENGMRRAVSLWDSVGYWQSRAAGALAHAKHKERADVRARRIKKIEADQRKRQRQHDEAVKEIEAWNMPGLTHERALFITNYSTMHISACFTLAKYPRSPEVSQYEGDRSLWSALTETIITAEQAREIALRVATRSRDRAIRWIAHYGMRLAYERAMLDETGYVEPPKRVGKAALPLLNYAGTVETRNRYREGTITYEAKPITRAEFAKIPNDYKGTLIAADGTHRVRMAQGAYLNLGEVDHNARYAYYVVFFTDSKQHPRPGQDEVTDARIAVGQAAIEASATERAQVRANNRAVVRGQLTGDPTRPALEAEPAPAAEAVDAMREQLREGIAVHVAPLLYPTPATIVEQMMELADVGAGMRVLEPSAGTGVLLDAVHQVGADTTAVELDYQLAERLRATGVKVHQGDFLQCGSELGAFDRVLMNPPFNGGADIAHIKHAYSMLAPGGILVAICAHGPRQVQQLQPLADATGGSFEALPAGSFKHAGTTVSTAILVLHARGA